MKFKFLGDCKEMVAFGYDFTEGKTPDVTDEKAIHKLSNNAEFEALPETAGAPAAKPVKPAGKTVEDDSFPSMPGEK